MPKSKTPKTAALPPLSPPVSNLRRGRKTKPTAESAVAKRLQAKLDATKAGPKAGGEDLGEFLARRDARGARKGKAPKAKPANGAAAQPQPTPEAALQAIAAQHGFTWDENAQAAFQAAFAAGQAAKRTREGGKRAIVAQMLQREDGATTRELLDATGWPAMSVPAMARASNLTLRTEKRDGATVYYGTPA